MASIDKLGLTCRLLYDQRVLEQRKEIETLKVKLFFRDYTPDVILKAMSELNWCNTRCKCSGCKITGRIFSDDTEDHDATCTFGPWFDNILRERGLVVSRKHKHEDINFTGPYLNEIGNNSEDYAQQFEFSDDDCHLVEMPDQFFLQRGADPHARWENLYIGRRLWGVGSVNDQGIIQFERVFCNSMQRLQILSPQTQPQSPKVAQLPQQELPITIVINQGLELKVLKEQLTAQAAELHKAKEQLATQGLELQTAKEQLATEATKSLINNKRART
jgi:hypothetical protein